MPVRQLKQSRVPKTVNLDGHKRTANSGRLTEQAKRGIYDDPRWRRARKLMKDHHSGCCVAGCNLAAAVTDHIIPINTPEGMRRAFDLTNLQPLCRGHHQAKTDRIDAPNGDPAQYRDDLRHEADMRPDALKQWADMFTEQGLQELMIGNPDGNQINHSKTIKGSISC